MGVFSNITWRELEDKYCWDYDLSDSDDFMCFMILCTERAQSLGYEIKEWTDKCPKGRRYGVIFRFFGHDEIDILFDDAKKDIVSDVFIDVHELRKQGSTRSNSVRIEY